MKYVLHATLRGTSVFTDQSFTVGKNEYSYDDVSDVALIRKSSMVQDGTIRITVGGKPVLAWFDYKQKEDGLDVYDFLQEIVDENKRYADSTNTNDSPDDSIAEATSLYRYCIDNKLGSGFNETWGVKHFRIILDNLMDGEHIIFPFIGMHNYRSVTQHDGYFAYAVTNKRILMAQQKLIGQIFQSVSWQNVNDVTLDTGMVFGTLTIDTYKERFNVCIDKDSTRTISTRIHEVFEEVKHPDTQQPRQAVPGHETQSLAYLKELKALLDDGIITEQEFAAKKKQILGL